MLGHLSLNIISSKRQTVFREGSSRKTVSFEEQIPSKNKRFKRDNKSEKLMPLICQVLNNILDGCGSRPH